MNDDQLTQELERRADSASSRAEWVRRDLVPFVRQEIAARPQPVVTSRWAPGLSVAAIIAALLILVVAVPRLAPQPPAASPSPDASTVLSAQQFSDGLLAGNWQIGQTFLVNGRISLDSFGPDYHVPPCAPPDGLCALGSLDGTQALVLAYYTPTTDTPGSGVWVAADGGKDYHFPSVPIEGVLVMRVGDYHEAEFVGVVRGAVDSARLSTFTDVTGMDPAQIGPDAALLVRGQLVSLSTPGGVRFCPIQTYPVLDDLPSRFCANYDALDTDGSGRRIEVQAGVGAHFGHDDAVYAISPRLYGAGCDGLPPCWRWDVVARVDGPVGARATQPPVVTPAPSQSSAAINCSGTDAWLSVSLTDHTGEVASCASHLGSEDLAQAVTVSNAPSDPLQLQFDLRVSSCDLRSLSLEFWQPPAGGALGEQSRATHEFQIDRSTTSITCVDSATEITSQTISLTLNTPIAAANVNAFVTEGRVASNTVVTNGNTFALTLQAGSGTYAAGSPIDISAIREYLGPEATTVANYGTSFGFEQLDGTLEMWPASTLVGHLGCDSEELQQGDIEGEPFSKSGGWSREDPNAAFYDEYMRDPQLRLPVGVYRIVGGMSFENGACGGERVSVSASIVIRVVAAVPTTPPPATPSPTPSTQPLPSSGVGTYQAGDSPTFALHISAPKAEYTLGESIDVGSSLSTSVDVTMICPTWTRISLQQIDGPLAFTPGPFVEVCPPDAELHSAAPFTTGFLPAVWGHSTVNPLEPYLRDGKLYLPSGTYLFVARATFGYGTPDIHRAGLEADLVITVH